MGQLAGHDNEITVVAARGSLAVSCQLGHPMRTRVWSLETMLSPGKLLEGSIGAARIWSACCMEGKVLLGLGDGDVRLWDVAASAPVALAYRLRGHTSGVCDIKAAATGSMILSGSDDKTVRLWDLRADGGCVRTMEGHSQCVQSVDMDGHCRTAVSGSEDSLVKLWDLGSGRCTETYEDHTDAINDVVMHESGSSFLSSVVQNGVVHAWAVGSTRAVMQANMESTCVPDAESIRMFAYRDLSTIVYCSISYVGCHLGVSIWR